MENNKTHLPEKSELVDEETVENIETPIGGTSEEARILDRGRLLEDGHSTEMVVPSSQLSFFDSRNDEFQSPRYGQRAEISAKIIDDDQVAIGGGAFSDPTSRFSYSNVLATSRDKHRFLSNSGRAVEVPSANQNGITLTWQSSESSNGFTVSHRNLGYSASTVIW